jgi:hypothetical protein
LGDTYVDVVDLIVVRVALSDGVGACRAQCVVVGDICGGDAEYMARISLTIDILVARPLMNGDFPAVV